MSEQGLDSFFTALCRGMGWEPTPWRIDVFTFWAQQEGMLYERTFNPLATTRTGPGITLQSLDMGFGPGNWNSVPVRMYATEESGVEATRQTLLLDYYVNVRRCFADQRGYPEAVGPRDFTSWVGSNVYGQRIVDHMNASKVAKTMFTPPASDITLDDIVLALFAGKEQAASRPTREQRLTYARNRVREAANGEAVSLVELVGAYVADHEHGGVQR